MNSTIISETNIRPTTAGRKPLSGKTNQKDASEVSGIPCPFCNQSDNLEIMDWTSERKDGTEYHGDAVKCHRCEAIVPVVAWSQMSLMKKTFNEKLDPSCDRKNLSPTRIESKVYWTFWRTEAESKAFLARLGSPDKDRDRLPHEGLTSLGFSSPEKLMEKLIEMGWKKTRFNNTGNRITRIEATSNGLTVTAFSTYSAAVKHHQAACR